MHTHRYTNTYESLLKEERTLTENIKHLCHYPRSAFSGSMLHYHTKCITTLYLRTEYKRRWCRNANSLALFFLLGAHIVGISEFIGFRGRTGAFTKRFKAVVLLSSGRFQRKHKPTATCKHGEEEIKRKRAEWQTHRSHPSSTKNWITKYSIVCHSTHISAWTQ